MTKGYLAVKLLCSHVFIDPAFEAEAILADLRLRVFHGGQKLIAQPDDLSYIDIWNSMSLIQ